MQEPQRKPTRRSISIGIILAAQTVVTAMFLMFAFYQKEEADTQRQMAEEMRNGLQKAEYKAREQQMTSTKLIDSLTTELNKLKAIAEKK